jgi:hypothetical protein
MPQKTRKMDRTGNPTKTSQNGEKPQPIPDPFEM